MMSHVGDVQIDDRPTSRSHCRRQQTPGGRSPSKWLPSRASSSLHFSVITLIATTLVISLVIGPQIQPADGQSTSGGSGALSLTTTTQASSSTSSSASLGSRGLKRASQQQQRQQQVAAAPLNQLDNSTGMAPFFSIKDGKTSARRIQQQQQQPAAAVAAFLAQRDSSTSSRGDGQLQRPAVEKIDQNTNDQAGQLPTSASNSNELMGANLDEQQQLDGNKDAQELDLNGPLNQLAPMGNVKEQQQQLANVVGPFNQLALADADRFYGGESKPELGGDDLVAPQDDAGRQQSSLAATAGDETNGAGVKRRIQSTGAGESAPSGQLQRTGGGGRQQPVPIKQSSANRADVLKPAMGVTKSQLQQRNRQSQGGQQIQQQQEPTGQPQASSGQLQQPSSLSMSLDGMIVNSRPRATTTATSSNNAANFEQRQFRGGVKSNQRGDSALNRNSGTSGNFNGPINQQSGGQQAPSVKLTSAPPPATSTTTMRTIGAGQSATPNPFLTQNGQQQRSQLSSPSGLSRRVPFSGVPFSSPASKGQRTKPKASNQFGGFSTASSLGDFNSTPINQAANRDPQRQQQQQFNSAQDDDQQKMTLVTLDGDQQLKVNEELMNSVMASLSSINNNNNNNNNDDDDDNNNQQQQARQMTTGDAVNNLSQARSNQVSTSKLANGDMLMSVISSEDGRERKLVMMSRDTLDNLQKFAEQQQQRAEQEPQQLQQVAELQNSGPTGTSLFGMPATSTLAANEFEQQTTPANNQRQQLATTTPVSFTTSIATTTQTPVDQPTSGSSDAGFGPATTTTTTTATSTTLARDRDEELPSSVPSGTGNSADTFREVSSGNNNANRQRNDGQAAAVQQTVNANRPTQQAENSGIKSTKLKSKQVAGATGGGGASSSQTNLVNENRVGQRQQQVATTQKTIQTTTDSGATTSSTVDEIQNTTTRPKASANGRTQGTKSKSKMVKQQQKSSGQSNGVVILNDSQIANSTTSATQRTKSSKTQKSTSSTNANQQQQQRPTANKTGRKQTAGSGAASLTAQTGAGQQQQPLFTSTTQAPAVTISTATNGQQLPKGRLVGATNGLDSSAKPLDETTTELNRGSSVETLVTNRMRLNGNSAPAQQRPNAARTPQESAATTNSAGPIAPLDRNELDRQLDQMERANAADANNQAASELDEDRNRSERVGGGPRGPVASELDGLRAAIPGEPLVDYPIYAEPPSSGSSASAFQCQAQSCPGGYYADPDTQCQVFHVCQQDGRMDTFLCPNGTIFSQQHFVCVWWWQVDCSQARSLYRLNDAIYCNSMSLPPMTIDGGGGEPDQTSLSSGNGNRESSRSSPTQQPSQSQARQRNGNNNNAKNSIVMSAGGNGVTMISSTPRTSTDDATPTTSDTSATNAGNSFDATTQPANGVSSPAARNETATDNLNENDVNQQQQQQLELLSRRAA